MKRLQWVSVVMLLALCRVADADTFVSYRPGYYTLATQAAASGVSTSIATRRRRATRRCGIVFEATVVESLSGAATGAKLRFVGDPSLRDTTQDGDAFAVLFSHGLPGSGSPECWVKAAPLFAAAHPASLVPFDRHGAEALGGDVLAVGPENILSALQFPAIEITLDGKNRHFASWELVRAYARQASAVKNARKLMPDWPSDPGPDAPPAGEKRPASSLRPAR